MLKWALIRLDGKQPKAKDWQKAIPLEPENAAGQWAEWGQRWNMGVVLGPSGLAVVEYDTEEAAATLRELLGDRLPETPIVQTGSGAHHLYFATPGGTRRSRDGLELRVGSHQCVVPPSIHPDTHRGYEWLDGREPWAVGLAEVPQAILEYFGSARTAAKAQPVGERIGKGQRNAELASAAGTMRRRGFGPEEIAAALFETNRLRCDPPLSEDEVRGIAESVSRYEPKEALGSVATEPAVAEPRKLEDVTDVFRKWLYLPDLGPLYCVLGSVAANRMDGDPVWLLLIAPPASGKTEILQACSTLEKTFSVATITEAALLSGAPQKDHAKGARGGLLREIGDGGEGILLLKDWGSILSMHRDDRSKVLAALREIYDGAWTRRLGVDGGKALHWHGKLGIVGGGTPAVDEYQAHMAALGERLLYYRFEADDREEQATRAMAHLGQEEAMRQELRETVRGLFGTLELGGTPQVGDEERKRLVALASFVSKARSAVIRHPYSRDIEIVPAPEAPARLAFVLLRFYVGLRAIGVAELEAWRVVIKVGFDSMPQTRLAPFLFLLSQEGTSTTTEVARGVSLPRQTVTRYLEDLTAHHVVVRAHSNDDRSARWSPSAWAVERYEEATHGVPEMSGRRFDEARPGTSGVTATVETDEDAGLF